jgi:hypothetical protein
LLEVEGERFASMIETPVPNARKTPSYCGNIRMTGQWKAKGVARGRQIACSAEFVRKIDPDLIIFELETVIFEHST